MFGAFLLLNCKLGCEESVVEHLRKIENVRDVGQVYGEHDLVVHVESETLEQLKQTINGKIPQIDYLIFKGVLICGGENEWRRFYGYVKR